MAQSTIKLGSSGPDVTELQNLLNAAGFVVPVTGLFDAKTDAVVRAFQKAKGLTADGVVGPMTWAALTGKAPPAAQDPRAAWARAILQQIWPDILAEAAESKHPEVRELGLTGPGLAELQMAAAMAKIESGYGQGTYTNQLTGEKKVLHNWGAVQAGAPPCGPNSWEATDTHQDGTPYQRCFRLEPDDQAGALEMVKHMTIRRPDSWRHMKVGDIDAWAEAMHNRLEGGKPKVDPITGIGGYFAQNPVTRAAATAKAVASTAATLNEPIGAAQGGPVLATGETEPGEPGVFDGVSGKKAIGPGVVLLGLGGLALTVWRWGWPWTWRF